jgi:peptide deformylase
MAVREILHFPDKRLRVPGKPVTEFDDELRKVIDDMAETMYDGQGVGLAAPQIGLALRLFIIDVANNDEDAPSELRVFVNPEITERVGEIIWNEGCLSFPGVREDVKRAERVTVRAQDASGKSFELEAEGLLAVAIQHEIDHLDGKLIIDHLSILRRRLVRRAMSKREVDAAAG